MNMMSNDIRYTQQTEALNEIAGKFGVVTCRPDRSGSRNTVLFYTEEDVEHNHLVDQQPTRYRWKEADDIRRRDGTQIPAECIYRDCFWSFENSDTDDRFNLDYALPRLEGTAGGPYRRSPFEKTPIPVCANERRMGCVERG